MFHDQFMIIHRRRPLKAIIRMALYLIIVIATADEYLNHI